MKIAIIVFVAVLSYLVVVVPGYYFIVPDSAEKITNFGVLTELPLLDAAKSPSKLSVANPGKAPPLK